MRLQISGFPNTADGRLRCNILFLALVRLKEGSGDLYERTQVHDASVGPLRSRRVSLKMQEHRIGNQVKPPADLVNSGLGANACVAWLACQRCGLGKPGRLGTSPAVTQRFV